jgi:gamma-glutamyltranspeptidase
MSSRAPEPAAARGPLPAPLVPARATLGSRAAVVAPHHLAAAAGLGVLRAGGHAVDAAIAANAVLGVVAPDACGLGGDAFWLVWDQAAGTLVALNGSGRSPAGSDATALRRAGLAAMPERGPLTITVPGAVRSWGDAHRRWGRLSRPAVLGPAIELARDGFAAGPGLIAAIEATALAADAAARDAGRPGPGGIAAGFHAVFRGRGRPWRVGERIRLPALARTLTRLADEGFDAFYEGDIGERQARFLAAAGAPFVADDLRDHRTDWGDALTSTYRGVRVATHPPNSSGVVALQLLRILERFEPPGPAAFGSSGPTDAGWLHTVVEAAKLALADRDACLTDPEAMSVGPSELLGDERVATLARAIRADHAAAPAARKGRAGGGTVYLAAVDADGNAVSLIESNFLGFGSTVVDAETGIHYQNRGTYFSLDPGDPNVLAPRKRTLHTLMPTMLFRDDPGAGAIAPWIVTGSMGGDSQPQIHAQIVSALVDGAQPIATAIAAPRACAEPAVRRGPALLVAAEPRFGPGILEALERIGHPVARTEPFDPRLGEAHAIELLEGGPAAGGGLAAVTDPRSEGLPATW